MNGYVLGVRLDEDRRLLFCYADRGDLIRGTRVQVVVGERCVEGTVAIAPDQILDAPVLDDAGRIVAVLPPRDGGENNTLPDGVLFLAAGDAAVSLSDLRRALRLAARPLPEAPPPRASRQASPPTESDNQTGHAL